MKFLPVLFLLSAALFPLYAEEGTPKITVTGAASRKIANDAATIQLAVENTAPTKKEAADKTREALQKLTAWLKGFGETCTFATTSLSVFPVFNQGGNLSSQDRTLPKVIGFTASALLSCEIEADAAGDFTAQATDNGATAINSVSFHIKDTTAAKSQNQLLTEAFNNAKEKASVLATAAEKKLGGAIFIQAAQNSNDNPVMPMARAFAASASDTGISPPFQMKAGDSTLNSSVTVFFELLPASQAGRP